MNSQVNRELSRVANDPVLSEAIKNFLLFEFTQPHETKTSVEEKAAEWLSIQKLQKAWRKLDDYKHKDLGSSVGTQIGL